MSSNEQLAAAPGEGRFAGKVVLVTGAASGLGRATTLRFAAEGGTVVGLDVNDGGLAETAAAAEAAGTPVTTRHTDISSRDECHAAVAEAVAAHGRLDVVANVAGVIRSGHFDAMTESDIDLVFKVNVFGTLWMCQAAIPHLLETRGNVVNVASNAGLMGQAYTGVYAASKAAVVNLTRSLAMEYVKRRIRINAVAPGGIDTPMANSSVLPEDADFALVQPYMGFRPLSPPDEIAAVILFVASDAARSIHGSIVSADNGLTAG